MQFVNVSINIEGAKVRKELNIFREPIRKARFLKKEPKWDIISSADVLEFKSLRNYRGRSREG